MDPVPIRAPREGNWGAETGGGGGQWPHWLAPLAHTHIQHLHPHTRKQSPTSAQKEHVHRGTTGCSSLAWRLADAARAVHSVNSSTASSSRPSDMRREMSPMRRSLRAMLPSASSPGATSLAAPPPAPATAPAPAPAPPAPPARALAAPAPAPADMKPLSSNRNFQRHLLFDLCRVHGGTWRCLSANQHSHRGKLAMKFVQWRVPEAVQGVGVHTASQPNPPQPTLQLQITRASTPLP